MKAHTFIRYSSLLALLLLLLLVVMGVAAHAQSNNGGTLQLVETDAEGKPIIRYANVFTPNGDGINDYFVPNGSFPRYRMWVYDRWGNLVHLGDQDMRWDGTSPQGALPEGVYVYRLQASTEQGDSVQHVGTVTLIR